MFQMTKLAEAPRSGGERPTHTLSWLPNVELGKHCRRDIRYRSRLASEREESLRRSGFIDGNGIEEALVLVLREHPKSPPGKRGRIVLMLLRWMADGRAERCGLLSNHVENWDFDFLKSLQTILRKSTLK
jgi:hypothetical protein